MSGHKLIFFIFHFSCFYAISGMSITTELTVNQSTQTNSFCVCMPYWLCKEDYSGLTDDISSVVDIRSMLVNKMEETPCTADFDMCCQVQCGRRRRSIYEDNKDFRNKRTEKPFARIFPSILSQRILGTNNEAEFGEFPWMLGILWKTVFQCGASLIHPQVAMTAAHCVAGKEGPLKVRAGEWNWANNDETLPHQERITKKVIIHQHYHPMTIRNDIALLVLDKPFRITESVGIVCIPPQNMNFDGAVCTASGWGKNAHYNGQYQDTLKKTDLPIVEREKCTNVLREARLGQLFNLHRSFICAGGEENKDTCKGDGGSPLVCPIHNDEDRYEQAGIVSWGLTCGSKNTPGVYVNVPLFSDWIDDQMQKLNFDTSIYRYFADN
ncbi:hypothetical protein WA026_017339 [Henosepilachna vigintioctopunctata]|uniref:Phenoloxidase-activating factor 2 n=1 Tax=Henosepilachna vigintioctopunctata TaxID=420089 RepID=A0AAW1TMZ7_9CUCU